MSFPTYIRQRDRTRHWVSRLVVNCDVRNLLRPPHIFFVSRNYNLKGIFGRQDFLLKHYPPPHRSSFSENITTHYSPSVGNGLEGVVGVEPTIPSDKPGTYRLYVHTVGDTCGVRVMRTVFTHPQKFDPSESGELVPSLWEGQPFQFKRLMFVSSLGRGRIRVRGGDRIRVVRFTAGPLKPTRVHAHWRKVGFEPTKSGLTTSAGPSGVFVSFDYWGHLWRPSRHSFDSSSVIWVAPRTPPP
jgi:hypothetical protein